jgi:O-antigen ligase
LFKKIDSLDKMDEIFEMIAFLSLILSIGSIILFFYSFERIEGTFSNPNYLALFLAMGFIIILFKEEKYKFFKLILISMAILFTGSRIVLINIILIFLLYILSYKKNILKKIIFIVILMLISFATILFQEKFRNKAEGSDLERLAILESSIAIIQHRPFTGIGYSQFQVKFKNYLPNTDLGKILEKRKAIVTHNDYLRVIDELGIFAFFYLLYLIYKQLKIKKQDNYSFIALGLLLNVLLFSFAHNNMNSLIFWFCLLLPSYIEKLRKSM